MSSDFGMLLFDPQGQHKQLNSSTIQTIEGHTMHSVHVSLMHCILLTSYPCDRERERNICKKKQQLFAIFCLSHSIQLDLMVLV